jgi:hypothetical protein
MYLGLAAEEWLASRGKLRIANLGKCAGVGTISATGIELLFPELLELLVDPPLAGSEQFSLQQRRATEASAVLPLDLAFRQQRGIFAFNEDPSAALMPNTPPIKVTMILKLRTRFRISPNYI